MSNKQQTVNNFWKNDLILKKSDLLAHQIYSVTKKFPKSELYGLTSQIRRSSLSVSLNIIEGYARFKQKSHINFLEISYGSLKETQYLIQFSYQEKLLNTQDFEQLNELSHQVAKMLYSKILTMRSKEVDKK